MGVEAGAILFDRAKPEKVPGGICIISPVTDRSGQQEHNGGFERVGGFRYPALTIRGWDVRAREKPRLEVSHPFRKERGKDGARNFFDRSRNKWEMARCMGLD
jgi:hypothetical protein